MSEDNQSIQALTTIKETNLDMLDYFSEVYIKQLETVQALKSELFELDVKLEELSKTKDLYFYNSDSRRNIFSPLIPSDTVGQERGRQLEKQLYDLQEARLSLTDRIHSCEQSLLDIQNRIQRLHDTNTCINSSLALVTSEQSDRENTDVRDTDQQAFEYDSPDSSETPANTLEHGYSILMLQQYEKTLLSDKLDYILKDGITSLNNKLEVLKWLLNSDPARARIQLQELMTTSNRIRQSIEAMVSNTNQAFKKEQPIWMLIDELIMCYRDQHPECVIEADVSCTDYELSIHPIITITLLDMLGEVFDNIFYHSNANRVVCKIYINNRIIDAYVNDNGVGISEDYLSTSTWHSGLHKLHEIIYLLDGKLKIEGDLISGTNVRFSFPVKLTNQI